MTVMSVAPAIPSCGFTYNAGVHKFPVTFHRRRKQTDACSKLLAQLQTHRKLGCSISRFYAPPTSAGATRCTNLRLLDLRIIAFAQPPLSRLHKGHTGRPSKQPLQKQLRTAVASPWTPRWGSHSFQLSGQRRSKKHLIQATSGGQVETSQQQSGGGAGSEAEEEDYDYDEEDYFYRSPFEEEEEREEEEEEEEEEGDGRDDELVEVGVEVVGVELKDDSAEGFKHRVGQSSAGSGGLQGYKRKVASVGDSLPPEGLTLLFACVVGLLTGVSVVAFNESVHLIRGVAWDGVPEMGAAWFRTQPLAASWPRVVLVPAAGGVVVGALNAARSSLDGPGTRRSSSGSLWGGVKAALSPVLKAAAAAVTLGTGNSLGPEGPSVEIGASIATGVGTVLRNSRERKLGLVAAGSAAGIASGFNAAVAGCFFAVESVLRASSGEASAASLTTAMILLSSVLAAVVSQAGLGPAFHVPAYEFRSPAELPLYLALGMLCGGVSIALTRASAYATQAFDLLRRTSGVPSYALPPLGGLGVGLIALAYPEVLYWGFANVDILLESRPLMHGAPSGALLLLQLAGVKVVATALARGSGLVGGVYAPSLFIGAALGSAYGRFASMAVTWVDPEYHITWIQVAAPQAYALVGMAATLAGVCQVPLTSVLLLFELTHDYRIILPLMAAVGIASWTASLSSSSSKRRTQPRRARIQVRPSSVSAATSGTSTAPATATAVAIDPAAALLLAGTSPLAASASSLDSQGGSGVAGAGEDSALVAGTAAQAPALSPAASQGSAAAATVVEAQAVAAAVAAAQAQTQAEGEREEMDELCLLDGSLCLPDAEELLEEELLLEVLTVGAAMRTQFAHVRLDSTVQEAVGEMVRGREWCCLVLGHERQLRGLLTLADVQQEAQRYYSAGGAAAGSAAETQDELVEMLPVTAVCNGLVSDSEGDGSSSELVTVQPDVTLRAAQRLMTPRGLRQLPVVAPAAPDGSGPQHVVGILDRDCIALACRAESTQRLLARLQASSPVVAAAP